MRRWLVGAAALGVAAFAAAVVTAPAAGWAQSPAGPGPARQGHDSWPDRVVRLVVAFPPGGPADVLGRVLADRLSARWRQPVVIENRAGAGGNVAAAAVARAAPDGYTLLLNNVSHVINASLAEALPYDPVKDFTPISEVAAYMLVLVVHPAVPATTLPQFVDVARRQPGGLTLANAGTGTPTHLTAVLFAQTVGLNFVHLSYRGAALATNDVVAGHIPAMFDNPVNAVPLARAGALRALAVTGARGLAQMPELPTIADSGYPGFEIRSWCGLFGPQGMAPDIVARIYADVRSALQDPEVAAGLVGQGWDLVVSPPDRFATVLVEERDRWAAVVRAAGIGPGH